MLPEVISLGIGWVGLGGGVDLRDRAGALEFSLRILWSINIFKNSTLLNFFLDLRSVVPSPLGFVADSTQ